ncbi:hypothetical protein PL321_15125 [Caloramator sp. mosi_1]|uniref:hypothetical protein n=1 Tax=Caloramator sp. mosi_1 TaxID=3023090 RepID=UPI002361ACB1|nr:hypothetical protein [Caloramator sp. mosi_1]WDC83810.1 hypothetical protein PL321_15125 [Caloramator sp. mosi_1]
MEKSKLIVHNKNSFYIARLYSENYFEGYLGVSIKSIDAVDKYYIEFLDELAELLSTQIEIIRLNTIAKIYIKQNLKH